MSSYFVNSFSGRYQNGPDYQLLNYGTSSSDNGPYRDSGTMHSSTYGYNYNGMDLSITRSPSSNHFGVGNTENSRRYPPATESRFRQTASCTLSSPEPIPCSGKDSHGAKGSPSDPATSSSSASNFTEMDEAGASSDAEESNQANSNHLRAQQESTQTTTAHQQPQIFPWMRKLHIGQGTHLFYVYHSLPLSPGNSWRPILQPVRQKNYIIFSLKKCANRNLTVDFPQIKFKFRI
uniref:Homeobox protein HoxB5 n=1 Tax=Callorhinchus milii TaxID=7868 RepID=V9LC63_CALMI